MNEDTVRTRIQAMAATCLDHIRAVRWGMATSEYTVIDGDLMIDVSIELKCNRGKALEPPK